MIGKSKVGNVLAVGVLGIGAFAIPFSAAAAVSLLKAPAAQASSCAGGGGYTPIGGGGGTDCWTAAGNHVQCGYGGGGHGLLSGGGGGCRITWTNGVFQDCGITVQVGLIVVPNVNPCPYVP